MVRSNMNGGAKLTPFCRRAKSFFMKFLPKEALKKQIDERLKPEAHTKTQT
jgi:hypothetical protein